MTTTQAIAFLGLGFFWLHTVLMAAHAWREGQYLRRRLRAWRDGLVPGRVVEARGEGEVFARHRVEQVGRSKGDGRIHFHDRAYVSEVLGGVVELDDGTRIDVGAGTRAEVWVEPGQRRAGEWSTSTDLEGPGAERAVAQATKARGLPRVLESSLGDGSRVWLYGLDMAGPPPRRVGGVEVADPRSSLVSSFDPRPWAARHARRAQLAAVAFVVLAGACSLAMLWPPRFGSLGVGGALAAVVVFNLLQLFLKLVRDHVRVPPIHRVGGLWRSPRSVSS